MKKDRMITQEHKARPLRILFSEQDATSGGSSHSLRILLEGLDTTRFAPSLLFCRKGSLKKFASTYPAIETRITGFENHDFAHNPCCSIRGQYNLLCWLLRFPFELAKALLLIHKCSPDLIHINNGQSLTVGIAARLLKVPVIWHIREMVRQNMPGRFQQWVYKQCSCHLICISNAVAKRLGNCSPRLRVIYNPVVPRKASVSDVDRFRSLHSVPESAMVVTLLGNISAEKGYLFLADVCDKLTQDKRFFFLLGGSLAEQPASLIHKAFRFFYRTVRRDPGEKQCIVRRWQSAVDTGRAAFTGFVDPITAIAASSVIVCPTLHSEPFGRTVIEAYAQAKPVLTSRVPAFDEIIDDNQSGWLLPLDPDCWAQTLKKLADQPALLIEAGRKAGRCLLRYDSAIHAQTIAKLYESFGPNSENS